MRALEKRAMSPSSAAKVSPSSQPTPEIVQQRGAVVGAGDPAEFGVDRRQPSVEEIDDRDRLGNRRAPHVRHAAIGERVDRPGLAQMTHAAAHAPLRQQPEDAVLRRCPQADQMHPPQQPL